MIDCLQNKVRTLTKTNEELESEMTSMFNKSKSFQCTKISQQKLIPEIGNSEELRRTRKELIDLRDLVDRYEINDTKIKQLLVDKESEVSQLKMKISKQFEEENLKIKEIIDQNNLEKEQLIHQISDLQTLLSKNSSKSEYLVGSLSMKEGDNQKDEWRNLKFDSKKQPIHKVNSLVEFNPIFHINIRDKTEKNIKIESLNQQLFFCDICKRCYDSKKYLSHYKEVKLILVWTNK